MAIGDIVNAIVNAAIIIFGSTFTMALIGFGFWMYKKNQKFRQFKCVIWKKDGFGNIVEEMDWGGIFVDKKTKNKRLFLKKNNVGLEPDNIPYITRGNTKQIYLLQSGLKNFKFIKPRINDDYLRFEVGEEDVNWAINAYERQKRTFTNDKLMQYLPFISLAFVSIIILLMFIFLFKKLDVLSTMASELNSAAQAIANAKIGTVVLPS